jgi:[acyl-carrier-protein] S-malonyltransferase
LATLRELGVDAVVELAPGGVLTGLVRRALPEVTAIALRTPQDLDAARRLIAEHADVGEQFSPSWRVLVAPAAGTFHTGDARVGEVLDAPTPIGSVRNRSGERVVTVDRPARLVELLARDGDPVGEGQPLARLAPTSA